jgi:hypothetical protein
MTEPYRSAAPRDPPTVIDYRNLSPWWPIGFLALFLGMMVSSSHRVTLHCERSFAPQVPGGFCASHDEGATGAARVEHFDLGKVRGARLVVGSKGVSRVALYGDHGNQEMTSRSESDEADPKAAFIAGVGAFLADPQAARLDVAYGSRWASGRGGLVFVLPFVALIGLLTRRVRVIVDGTSRQVRVQRSRFPLPPSEEGFDLDEVTGAEVQESEGSRSGTTYRVALVLSDGRTVPLRDSYGSGRDAKEKAVARIVAALRAAQG